MILNISPSFLDEAAEIYSISFGGIAIRMYALAPFSQSILRLI